MCGSCGVKIDDLWFCLMAGQVFKTPDHARGQTFTIDQVTSDSITILPQGITINRICFVDSLHYLRENRHNMEKPCEIRSNDDPNLAGPLCLVARNNNRNQRCINYILPILQNNGLVGIGCSQPNTTWVIGVS